MAYAVTKVQSTMSVGLKEH